MIDTQLITNAMKQLRLLHPALTHEGGFTQCAYGSELFRQELESLGIDSLVLVGKIFRDTPQALAAKAHMVGIVSNIQDDETNDELLVIKQQFDKRGKLLTRIGHAVLLIDDQIFDITSGQFGLTESYSLKFFKEVWAELYHASVEITGELQYDIDLTPRPDPIEHQDGIFRRVIERRGVRN